VSHSPYKHPTVFVGCPYTPETTYQQFKETLKLVPLEFIYADSAIKTHYILERIRSGVTRADYCLFDITGWNPNVTLEVGLSEGVNRDYYILFRPGTGKKRNPPSDLHGKQRINYKRLDGFKTDCLEYQLDMHLVKSLTHPRNVYDQLSGSDRIKKFIVAMRLLAHFKESRVLTFEEVKSLSKGSYYRDADLRSVVKILRDRSLLKGKVEGNQWKAGRALFKRVSF
jgi:hypothetical protein